MSTDPSDMSKKFDMESTLGVLEKLAHEEARTPEDVKAIRSAAEAIHFIHVQGKLEDFQDYLRDVEGAAERSLRAEQSFQNMSEAINWLHTQSEPRFGTIVEVAGNPFWVVRQRKETWFLIPAPRLPSVEELERDS
ncbi:hypothetical protein [Archangium sp.]|jgi:hypothetical protein|uniref:hypothetical protein n=1 Tax=Archangium sp. TaxID=1872627 RepID=UPI002EDB1F15